MKKLWEILVPTLKNPNGKKPKNKFFSTKYHKIWDEKVRKISGGLTILKPSKGEWLSNSGELVAENMIPVRIFCETHEIEKIADMVKEHYNQKAVMYYCISQECFIKNYE